MSSGANRVAARSWIGLLARAVIALAAGAFVTFSADHSAALGFGVFGAFAVVTGALGIALAATRIAGPSRMAAFVCGVLSLAAGVVAFAAHQSDAAAFAALVAAWGIVTGGIELVVGIRTRRRSGVAPDALVAGVLTAALGVVIAVVPRDSLLLVGLFGAYAVVLGVFVGIGAFTVREQSRQAIAGGGS